MRSSASLIFCKIWRKSRSYFAKCEPDVSPWMTVRAWDLSEIPPPTTSPTCVADALGLAGSTWPDRIVVLPEAMSSAEEFRGHDLDEAWGVASSLATVLWGLYFDGERPTDIAEEYRRRSGYELSVTETSLTKESIRMRRSRERSYEGKMICCWAHVKGKSTNPELALRAYYWVDAERELIIVGHFGRHLETGGTARVSA